MGVVRWITERNSTRFQRSIIAVALFVPLLFPTSAPSDELQDKKFKDIIKLLEAKRANEEDIASFGNWRILHIKSNDSYELIGVGEVSIPPLSNDKAKYFSFQCFVEAPTFNMRIPYGAADDVKNLPAVTVNFWNETAQGGEIKMLNYNGAVLIAQSQMTVQLRELSQVLLKAGKFFAWSYPGKTVRYETEDVVAALSKWKSMCPKLQF